MLAKVKCIYSKYEVSWLTYLLICLFGIGSWVAVNGLLVELPLFVDRLPEKWNLPSYLIIVIQLANIGPLAYSIGKRLAPNVVTEEPVIILIVTIGAISCVLLSLFWDKVTLLFGVKHSTALLSLSFCLAIVDCTSTVVFLTFMANFPSMYMSALFVGETLSGMLPGFIILAQGIDGDKCANNGTTINTTSLHENINFSPNSFFLVLFAMTVVCGVSFLALNYLPTAKKQKVKITNTKILRHRAVSEEERESFLGTDTTNSCGVVSGEQLNRGCTFKLLVYLLAIQAWINCLDNGILPSVQDYACKPYGNKTYFLVVTLTSISSALTCFVALWLPCRSPLKVTVFSIVYTTLSAYILFLAAMSPSPPLHDSTSGAIIVVSISVISGSLISYTKLTICTIMRDVGKRALFWCGIAIQTGSFLGAVLMFPLVNVAKVFHQPKQQC